MRVRVVAPNRARARDAPARADVRTHIRARALLNQEINF